MTIKQFVCIYIEYFIDCHYILMPWKAMCKGIRTKNDTHQDICWKHIKYNIFIIDIMPLVSVSGMPLEERR